MAAIGQNSILVYGGLDEGGKKISDGVLIDLTQNKEHVIKQDNFGISSYSQGFVTTSGDAVGLANLNKSLSVVSFRPDLKRMVAIKSFSN